MGRFRAVFLGVMLCAAVTGSPHAQDNWTLTSGVTLTSRWFNAGKIHEQQVTGDLFRPKLEGRLPAAAIINSSGGVTAHTELYYGRLLAAQGLAALVVDSFMPRGVRRTTDDQSRVWQSQSDADAAGAFHWLAAQPWVDPDRIIVLGMSRGGQAALHMAIETERKRLRTTDVRFAAHVAIATGGCSAQAQDARTTGAPIFFMLAELDDYTPIRPCFEYIDRMRAAGNDNIRLAVYPGVYHAYESASGIHQQQAETGSACSLFRNADGRLIDRRTGAMLPAGRERATLMQSCVQQRAVTTGGDVRVKAQATADLLQFLRDIAIVEARSARGRARLHGDCGRHPSPQLRACVRGMDRRSRRACARLSLSRRPSPRRCAGGSSVPARRRPRTSAGAMGAVALASARSRRAARSGGRAHARARGGSGRGAGGDEHSRQSRARRCRPGTRRRRGGQMVSRCR